MNLITIGSLPAGATNLADQAAAGISFGRATLGSAVSLGELTTVVAARDVGVVGLLGTTVKGSDLALGLVQTGNNTFTFLTITAVAFVRTQPVGVVD